MGTPVAVIRPSVSQDELRALVGLQNQIRQLSKLYNSGAADVMKRILSGAAVESGIHTAEIEQTFDGPARVEKLLIY